MKEEILKLQLREAQAQQRAKERLTGLNKAQTAVKLKHSHLGRYRGSP